MRTVAVQASSKAPASHLMLHVMNMVTFMSVQLEAKSMCAWWRFHLAPGGSCALVKTSVTISAPRAAQARACR